MAAQRVIVTARCHLGIGQRYCAPIKSSLRKKIVNRFKARNLTLGLYEREVCFKGIDIRPTRSSSVKSRSQSVAAIVAIDDELWSRRPCDMKPGGWRQLHPAGPHSPEDTSALPSPRCDRRNYVCNRCARARNCRSKNDESRWRDYGQSYRI